MTLDRLKISHLIISKAESLLEVFDHLFNLPAFGIILDYLDRREINISRDQIDGLLAFLFYYDHSHLTYPLNFPNHLSHLKVWVLPVELERDLPKKEVIQKTPNLDSFLLYPENRIGFELGDYVIASLPTTFNQFLAPIPTIHEDIDFTRDRKFEAMNNPLSQIDFRVKWSTSFSALGMVEFGPQGEEELSVKEGRKDPLVAKDLGHLIVMVSIPGAARNLFPSFLNQRIIDNKKYDGLGFNVQGMEEVFEFDFSAFFHGPNVLSQKSSKAGEGAL